MPVEQDAWTALAEAEARLDRALAAARQESAETIEAARQRVAAADRSVADAIDRERARIEAELAEVTACQLQQLADEARAQIARFAAVQGDALAEVTGALARRLAELAHEEDAP